MHRLHLDAGLAFGWLRDLEHLQLWRNVDAKVGWRLLVDRFLLGLHDVRQGRIARLVEAQIRGHYGEQFYLNRLKTAVDYALDLGRPLFELELVRKSPLQPTEQ